MSIPEPVAKILLRLRDVHPQRDGSWVARCPAHDDRSPSLHVTLKDDRILLKCFAGCDVDAICASLGIDVADLFLRNGDQSKQRGLTLDDFARAKRLDVEHLARHYVTQTEWHSIPAVAFVYRDADGDYWTKRYRIALTGDRFRWENGTKANWLLYGAWFLPEWRDKHVRNILLVEGETDCLTLWQAGIPAIGVPGAENLSERSAKLLDGFNVVLWAEPDSGGGRILERARELFGDRLRVITPPDGVKDPSELWLRIVSQHASKDDVLREFREKILEMIEQASVPESRCAGVHIEKEHAHLEPETADEECARCAGVRLVSDTTKPVVRYLGSGDEPAPPKWLVRGLIPARFTTNLYAESGHGKSYLVLHLALSVITGKPFAGEPVMTGEVLYLDWELDFETTDYRWWRVCRGGGFDRALSRGLAYQRMLKPIHETYDEIRAMVAEQRPVLVVVDSLGKALGNDPLDPKAVIRTYALLDSLNVAVLVIDHQSKPQGGDADYGSKWEFGSSYKRHYARSSFQLERVGDNGDTIGLVLRHKKSNFGALHPDVHLIMRFITDATGDLHAVQFETPESLGEIFGTRSEILKALSGCDLTVNEIAERVGLSPSRVRHELLALKKSGKVIERETRERGAKVWGLQVCAESLHIRTLAHLENGADTSLLQSYDIPDDVLEVSTDDSA